MKTITLKLTIKNKLDKDNKEMRNDNKELIYDQHDPECLVRLLSAFDSSKYKMSDYRNYLDLVDKSNDVWRRDEKEIELSLDQVGFLKNYLKDYNEKALPGARITQFELRTLVGLVDQLK